MAIFQVIKRACHHKNNRQGRSFIFFHELKYSKFIEYFIHYLTFVRTPYLLYVIHMHIRLTYTFDPFYRPSYENKIVTSGQVMGITSGKNASYIYHKL